MRPFLSLTVSIILSSPLCGAEDAGLAESSAATSVETAGESTAEAGNPFFITVAGPEAAGALLVSGTVLLVSAASSYGWAHAVTKLRYARAADEAKVRLASHDPIPLGSEKSVLRQVAALEQNAFLSQHPGKQPLADQQLAALVVLRSQQLQKLDL